MGHKNPSLRNRSPPSSHDFNRSESLPGRLPMSTFVSTNFCSPGWKMYLFLESTLTLENKTFLYLYRMPLKKTDEMTEFTGILCCQLDVPTQVAWGNSDKSGSGSYSQSSHQNLNYFHRILNSVPNSEEKLDQKIQAWRLPSY